MVLQARRQPDILAAVVAKEDPDLRAAWLASRKIEGRSLRLMPSSFTEVPRKEKMRGGARGQGRSGKARRAAADGDADASA
jgi:hypothetical protein